MARKEHPSIDIHLLEYIIASYLINDVEKQEISTEENQDFIKANEMIEKLIEQKREIDKEYL
jgi:hypothetical protein